MSSIKKDQYKNQEKNKITGGTLYLVATPIGNLADITERAVKTLSEVDFIAAEDTRNTARLLAHLGIGKPLVSYFEHNKRERGEYIAGRLAAGESCALVTDAGMPAVSDPGEDLVALCAERGIPATVVPGACAAVAALALSALPTGRFVFEGFLPMNKSERRARLDEIRREHRTVILYEAPHKLRAALADIAAVCGADRRVSLCRELTKINEEIERLTLGEALDLYKTKEPRGEYVLVLNGTIMPGGTIAQGGEYWADLDIAAHVEHHIGRGLSKMDAIKAAAAERGLAKSIIYKEFTANSE